MRSPAPSTRTVPRRRAGWIVAILMTLAAAMSTAQPAVAAEIPSLDGPVTDRTGVLDGRVGEIETAIEDLLDEANVQLWVLFVPTTEDLNATDYATEAAAANSLGANDALLVVAIDDRTDAIWVAD
ncbi:MAG TPA: TPM domain-containing protein, partial [Candidatus Limnocylindrales bacterium]